MPEWLDWLQWPAMVVTVLAAWLVGSTRSRKRVVGFWLFLSSNVLWIAWGLYAEAWALIIVQLFLAGMNFYGLFRNDPAMREKVEQAGSSLTSES
ncbi:MAG: hypothetical protein RBS88_11675 [Spongiibacteraceae bacterium]|jgi:hypothetical protein|nr:hypothetical protein [Spongiibacteraceae bacterium]